jgi:hypothetical protein
MINPIIWVIVSLVGGAIFSTLWGYAWAKYKHPTTTFNINYFFSMLITMIISFIVVPFVLNNQEMPAQIAPLIAFGCFAIGFTVNSIINVPLTNYLNKMDELNKLRVNAMALSPAQRRTFEILAAIFLIAMVFITGVYAAITYTASVTTSGNITGVGITIYSDSGGNNILTSINWGTFEPGASVKSMIYVKSTSNVPVTISLTTNTWQPTAASGYLTLVWNYNGGTLSPGVIYGIELTLTASTTAPSGTSFSFNALITATTYTQ